MKATKSQINKANKIAQKYTKGFIPMSEIQKMYSELADVGITTGIITPHRGSCEWYINDEEVENSLYCYSIYKSERTNNVEFTIYFS